MKTAKPGMTASTNLFDSFPLTPALSLEEKENRRPTCRRIEPPVLVKRRSAGLPLPQEEGWGEGERDDRTEGSQPCKRLCKTAVGIWALVVLVRVFVPAFAHGAEPKPLVNAHAHNDYEHPRPLLDALDRGFCSIEADVWLVDGQLRVAHDRGKTKPGRTLQRLYLDPLQARLKQNAGRVYAGGPSLTLMVDVKSGAADTWLALRAALKSYEPMLTRFGRDGIETGAVTVIVSGNRARDLMASDTNRLAGYDGRLADLESGAPPQLIPLVSDQWLRISNWRGGGKPIPALDERRLRDTVSKAHAQGRRIRFWGAPDTPEVWEVFRNAGVDLLNADDLDGLREFLLKP